MLNKHIILKYGVAEYWIKFYIYEIDGRYYKVNNITKSHSGISCPLKWKIDQIEDWAIEIKN